MSALAETLKKRFAEALRAQDTVAKEILRLAVGEMGTAEGRAGRALTDEEVQGILRKLVKSNEETLGLATDAGQRAALTREIEVLQSLLPRALGVDEIAEALAPAADAVRAAKNDGQATGIAVKHLRAG